MTTQAVVHRFAGDPADANAFTGALRGLAATAAQAERIGLLLTTTGAVLAVSDAAGLVLAAAEAVEVSGSV